MKTSNCLISACRSCRYYQPEGRRGGQCQLLSAPVRGSWKACSLAFPPFAPSWEHLEGLMALHSEEAELHERLPIRGASDAAKVSVVTSENTQPLVEVSSESLLV